MLKARAARRNCQAKVTTEVSVPVASPSTGTGRVIPTDTTLSASRRKVNSFDVHLEYENKDLPSSFVDLDCFSPIVKTLLCPNCKTTTLVLREGTGTKGFSIHLRVWCSSCEEFVSEGYTSPRTSNFHEINRKVVASCVSAGMGLAGINRMCEGLGIRGMHKKVYQSQLNAVFNSA